MVLATESHGEGVNKGVELSLSIYSGFFGGLSMQNFSLRLSVAGVLDNLV